MEHLDWASISHSWSLPLWLTLDPSKDFRLLVLLHIPHSDIQLVLSTCHTELAFQGKVLVTLHLIIINFCVPQDLSPMFLYVVVQTGHAKS